MYEVRRKSTVDTSLPIRRQTVDDFVSNTLDTSSDWSWVPNSSHSKVPEKVMSAMIDCVRTNTSRVDSSHPFRRRPDCSDSPAGNHKGGFVKAANSILDRIWSTRRRPTLNGDDNGNGAKSKLEKRRCLVGDGEHGVGVRDCVSVQELRTFTGTSSRFHGAWRSIFYKAENGPPLLSMPWSRRQTEPTMNTTGSFEIRLIRHNLQKTHEQMHRRTWVRKLRIKLKNLVLTKIQQEVWDYAWISNANWWAIAVQGDSPEMRDYPWRRHLFVNLILLSAWQTQVSHNLCKRALEDAPPKLPLTRNDAEEGMRFCRWACASYMMNATCSNADIVLETLSLRRCGNKNPRLVHAEVDDNLRLEDPWRPCFLVAVDAYRHEVIISIRGTACVSELLVDLVADPVPFAGGMAHSGMARSAVFLNSVALSRINAEVVRLRDDNPARGCPRVVLTGHSLGAGIASLTCLLWQGAEAYDQSSWQPSGFPTGVDLRMWLYASPLVFTLGANASVHNRAAFARVQKCSVAFVFNHDMVARTSMHTGFKLVQSARALDSTLGWTTTHFFQNCLDSRQLSEEKRLVRHEKMARAIGKAVKTSKERGIWSWVKNPFLMLHAVPERVYQLVGIVGGAYRSAHKRTTETNFPEKLPESDSVVEAPRVFEQPLVKQNGIAGYDQGGSGTNNSEGTPEKCRTILGSEEPVQDKDCDAGHAKGSKKLANLFVKQRCPTGGWSLCDTWIADGCLHLLPQRKAFFFREQAKGRNIRKVQLTAAATFIEVTRGQVRRAYDPHEWPPTIVHVNKDTSEAIRCNGGCSAPPTKWSFNIQNSAVEGACKTVEDFVQLCATSFEERRSSINVIVDMIKRARILNFTVLAPSLNPSHQCLFLADDMRADHQLYRYQVALESLLYRPRSDFADHQDVT